jgi:uncharacterized membrane protein YfcA
LVSASEFFKLVGIGVGAGAWGSLIGAGGGFIIVPLLLLRDRSLEAATATAISLIAVFANGLSGTFAYARQRRIDYRTGALCLVATLPGGVSGAIIVNTIDRGPFQAAFGVLLGLVALYIAVRGAKRDGAAARGRGEERRITDSTGASYTYRADVRLGVAACFIIGFLSSMLGVGGGIFAVPVFTLVIGIPIQIATATSQFMFIGTSFIANVTNIAQGDLEGFWLAALALAIGTATGAQIGARLAKRMQSVWISRALACGLLVVGARLAFAGFTE